LALQATWSKPLILQEIVEIQPKIPMPADAFEKEAKLAQKLAQPVFAAF
jgi:hypothetical protein